MAKDQEHITGEAKETHLADYAPSRARSRGILLAALMALVVFSLSWYLLAPSKGVDLVAADTTTAGSLSSYDPFYMLLIGSDSRKGTALYTGNTTEEGQKIIRADVLTLVRVNPREETVTFVSIPRNTLSIGSDAKINEWLEEGNPQRTIEEVEKLTGIEIDYYALVNFAGFEEIIDAIGGVVIDVPDDASFLDPLTGREVHVSAGPRQQLNGAEALAVVSSWEKSNELESLRQVSIRAVERGILNAAAQGDEDHIRRIATVFNSNVKTNLEDSLLLALMLDYATSKDDYTVYFGSGPYRGSVDKEGSFTVFRDASTWKRLMDVVDEGGDPNSVVVTLASGSD
ncbi:MAG: LCP family protein [Eggerthellaceae bacterium]|nr:LCP family protein [Eggerthellaceae bacterium]